MDKGTQMSRRTQAGEEGLSMGRFLASEEVWPGDRGIGW